ncbi:MAG: DUF664 domain-containing protein [Actinomycetota bacterium]
MTVWPIPDRTNPPLVSGEREALEAWVDYHRATLLMKCAGLEPEQLATRSCPPSSLSLLGLVRHLTEVESWFHDFDGRPEGEWCSTEEDLDACFDAVDPPCVRTPISWPTRQASTELALRLRLAAWTTYHRSPTTVGTSRCDGSTST